MTEKTTDTPINEQLAPFPGFAIARLRLAPEDVLVVKVNTDVDAWTIEKLAERIGRYVDHRRVLVIDRKIDFTVLTRDEIEARAEPPRQPPERIIDLPRE
ncbi:MAG: hypothetical protein AB7H90_01225 [Alphaproteobacteria bacterium]